MILTFADVQHVSLLPSVRNFLPTDLSSVDETLYVQRRIRGQPCSLSAARSRSRAAGQSPLVRDDVAGWPHRMTTSGPMSDVGAGPVMAEVETAEGRTRFAGSSSQGFPGKSPPPSPPALGRVPVAGRAAWPGSRPGSRSFLTLFVCFLTATSLGAIGSLPSLDLLPSVSNAMSAAASTSATAATPAPADTSSLPVVDLDLYLRDPSSAAGQAECEKVRPGCWPGSNRFSS